MKTEAEYLSGGHTTTMSQNQRKEILRVITMPLDGQPFAPDAANMNDRQVYLTWLRMCDHISQEGYDREFAACIGNPLF